ncbi:MAG: recombinase family protein [Dehalococcoidia bacterium]
MQRAVIYTRVSTDHQEEDGTSLDTQRERCFAHAAARGFLVVDARSDTASGYSLDRPGLNAARQLVRAGAVDVLLAFAVDRLSRNQAQVGVLLDEVDQHGARLEFVSEDFEDSAVGRLILNVRAFAGEMEREKIAERTMRGKRERARAGRIPQGTGKGIFGYHYLPAEKRREVNPAQAAVVRRIFDRYLETRSFSTVSHELNADAIPAHQGGDWYPLTIRRVLTNEAYLGRTVYGRTRQERVRGPDGKVRKRAVERPPADWLLIEGATPRLVDDATWERVQSVIADPARVASGRSKREYLLSGRIRCLRCGSAAVPQTLKGRYFYYRCRHAYDRNSGRQCDARYVNGHDLDAKTWAEVVRLLTDPATVLEELRQARERNPGDCDELGRANRALDAVTARQSRLVALLGDGLAPEDEVRRQLNAAAAERATLEAEVAQLEARQRRYVFDASRLEEIRSFLGGHLDAMDMAGRKLALEALAVVVHADQDGWRMQCSLPFLPGDTPLELAGGGWAA